MARWPGDVRVPSSSEASELWSFRELPTEFSRERAAAYCTFCQLGNQLVRMLAFECGFR